MASETITKEIQGQTVTFSGIDTLLLEKVTQLLDAKIQREIPLNKLREEMAGFGFTSTIEGTNEVVTGVDTPSHVPLPKPKGKRGRKAGDKSIKAVEIIQRMDADGKPEKEILKVLMKELDIPYPNAYYYYKKTVKK